MTYIISLAIQIAVVVAVIAVVLLLVRQGRPPERDENAEALDRLRQDLGLTQETILNALGDRITRSAAETRQILADRAKDVTGLEGQLKDISGHEAELVRRVQESNSHMTSLLHRHDELSVRLVDLIQRKIGGLTEQVAEIQKKQPTELAVLASRVTDAIAQAVELSHRNEDLIRQESERHDRTDGGIVELNRRQESSRAAATERMLAALRESETALTRIIQQISSAPLPYLATINDRLSDLGRTQKDQLAGLAAQLQAMSDRLENYRAEIESLRHAVPESLDYRQFAAADAIPLSPGHEAVTPDGTPADHDSDAPAR